MELLICSPSACVGSTNQWEATQSSSSLARYILRPVQSEFFFVPRNGRGCVLAVRLQKFSSLCEVAL